MNFRFSRDRGGVYCHALCSLCAEAGGAFRRMPEYDPPLAVYSAAGLCAGAVLSVRSLDISGVHLHLRDKRGHLTPNLQTIAAIAERRRRR